MTVVWILAALVLTTADGEGTLACLD